MSAGYIFLVLIVLAFTLFVWALAIAALHDALVRWLDRRRDRAIERVREEARGG